MMDDDWVDDEKGVPNTTISIRFSQKSAPARNRGLSKNKEGDPRQGSLTPRGTRLCMQQMRKSRAQVMLRVVKR